ncbi:hypothetical protein SAMN05428945_1017 [Streptomyces sp. 2224.1]|uniref:hypothetical protein n=1 Tax=unclassified Streptomyces TaxID=2593676 RepID=UPI000888DE46|nr:MULTISPECIES: hypothetical protein [unclassified Streptomyces]PBC84377.1 hypothetical protein BX261_4365 [Streptomyces sp. 2321.6]SDR31663.1 hypothetical protein SAMN05216511_2835 [Streptomyces sp. KS_16]SEB73675.1 hypothetical protein SAMN05428945_1017 [Streptomyces sp. 2224.1]SED29251.1 hypothetical protein SAMN05428940_4392 [Streptomyces sp. 2133.1]SNC70460.1 hypothetical protein SAMN06272741_4356 [Streptomyces sp. 2114.4]
MSELANVSAEIAPYLALAANSMGTSVLTAAQQRIAERTVTAGEGFFRRLLRRDDGTDAGLGEGADPGLGEGAATPLLDLRRADALDALLARLDDQERHLLSAALTAWLRSPADRRDAPHFLEHVTRLAPAAAVHTVHNTPTATGQGSIAAVEIHGDIHMGGGPAPRNGS